MIKPINNIFESTLLGTGGGYGESLVIHLGNSHWIVIDSCINPKTNESLPLTYLEKLGVDLSNDVKLIICTHWHDDHIRGISKLLERCNSAIFSMSTATDRNKFLRFLGFDNRKGSIESSISSTYELNACLEILAQRNATFRQCIEDRVLLAHKDGSFEYTVFSLSPSDYVLDNFTSEISTLITEYGTTNRKIIVESPNSKSSAIFIKVNDLRILLGSDLEVDLNCNRKGWLRVLDFNNVIDKKCTLFKIPHHGSENGDHERIWDELLIMKPVSKLTPWNKGKKLPKSNMLGRIQAKSEIALITSSFHNLRNRPKSRDKDMDKMIRVMKPSLEEVRYSYGEIRCRANILGRANVWSIEFFGTAALVDDNFIRNYPIG